MVATSAFSRLSSLALAILKKPPALPGEGHESESFSALILLTALTRLLLSALLSRLLTTLAGLLTRLLLPAAALLATLPAATLVLLVGALFVRIHHFHS
jgi:hypothetical protein